MAKQQTFGDKVAKGAGKKTINVKVIQGFRSEKGTTKYKVQFVPVNDIPEVDKINLLK